MKKSEQDDLIKKFKKSPRIGKLLGVGLMTTQAVQFMGTNEFEKYVASNIATARLELRYFIQSLNKKSDIPN